MPSPPHPHRCEPRISGVLSGGKADLEIGERERPPFPRLFRQDWSKAPFSSSTFNWLEVGGDMDGLTVHDEIEMGEFKYPWLGNMRLMCGGYVKGGLY